MKILSNIDAAILPLVRCLNAHGFPTIGSCQGGEGHAFRLPTVQVRPDGDLDELRKALCAFMVERRAEGFTVKTVSMHQRTIAQEPCSYLELELWSYDTLSCFAL